MSIYTGIRLNADGYKYSILALKSPNEIKLKFPTTLILENKTYKLWMTYNIPQKRTRINGLATRLLIDRRRTVGATGPAYFWITNLENEPMNYLLKHFHQDWKRMFRIPPHGEIPLFPLFFNLP